MQTELSKLEQELDAGRRSSARQRSEEFTEEVAAGQGAVARVSGEARGGAGGGATCCGAGIIADGLVVDARVTRPHFGVHAFRSMPPWRRSVRGLHSRAAHRDERPLRR